MSSKERHSEKKKRKTDGQTRAHRHFQVDRIAAIRSVRIEIAIRDNNQNGYKCDKKVLTYNVAQ